MSTYEIDRQAYEVARQIERDNLDEIIAAAEAEHGPITAAEVQEKRELLGEGRRRIL